MPLSELSNVGDADLLGGSLYIPALAPARPKAEVLDRMAQS